MMAKIEALKDTAVLMASGDYKERFVAEIEQLRIRTEKLRKLCNEITVSEMLLIEPVRHTTPLSVLEDQLYHMDKYLRILEQRALIEDIEL